MTEVLPKSFSLPGNINIFSPGWTLDIRTPPPPLSSQWVHKIAGYMNKRDWSEDVLMFIFVIFQESFFGEKLRRTAAITRNDLILRNRLQLFSIVLRIHYCMRYFLQSVYR